jgi:hypothetical protein
MRPVLAGNGVRAEILVFCGFKPNVSPIFAQRVGTRGGMGERRTGDPIFVMKDTTLPFINAIPTSLTVSTCICDLSQLLDSVAFAMRWFRNCFIDKNASVCEKKKEGKGGHIVESGDHGVLVRLGIAR